jgi:hypothetical protein
MACSAPARRIEKPAVRAAHLEQRATGCTAGRQAIEHRFEIALAQGRKRGLARVFAQRTFGGDRHRQMRARVSAACAVVAETRRGTAHRAAAYGTHGRGHRAHFPD